MSEYTIQDWQRCFARKALNEKEHRFDRLYPLICRREWIEFALDRVLSNTGSRTPGLDGISRKDLRDEAHRSRFIAELQAELQARTYRPQPVKRTYIPKANGKMRPLGIPTMKDRTVQMLLKMVLEPIYESDFLPVSNGFRPGRCTMDCIEPLRGWVNNRNGYFWVIEGDVKGCFDHIDHHVLMRLLRQRIVDRHVLGLIERFLAAGVMEEGRLLPTREGVPQGGICSPLLANIYLHELDLWWQESYNFERHQRGKRRKRGLGNVCYLRYADDFILLCNGTEAQAAEVRDNLRDFLRDELHLELSMEKTAVTHVKEGFDFLGYHIRWRTPSNTKPWLRITPTEKNLEQLRDTIRDMTGHRYNRDLALYKFQAMNRLLRGWINYYRHVNTKVIAQKLDWWVNDRMVRWLVHKHRVGIRRVLGMYKVRQPSKRGGRNNLAVKGTDGRLIYLYRMADVPITLYFPRKRSNPYLGEQSTEVEEPQTPWPEQAWKGYHSEPNRELYHAVLARDGYRCCRCGSNEDLHVHHRTAQALGGEDNPDNLETLCAECHRQTDNYGGATRRK